MGLGLRLVVAGVFVIAWNVTTFLMIFIVPGYKKHWDDYGVQLSPGKEALIHLSDFMSQWWFAFLPVVLLAAVLFVVWPHFVRHRI